MLYLGKYKTAGGRNSLIETRVLHCVIWRTFLRTINVQVQVFHSLCLFYSPSSMPRYKFTKRESAISYIDPCLRLVCLYGSLESFFRFVARTFIITRHQVSNEIPFHTLPYFPRYVSHSFPLCSFTPRLQDVTQIHYTEVIHMMYTAFFAADVQY